jgi:aryl-alcohol dehydrogenase-like predicted oxidoreductase
MKVYGGAKAMDYQVHRTSALGVRPHHLAFRYALGLPGVAVAVIGAYTVAELEQNIAWARGWEPLTGEEAERLAAEGRAVAAEWGAHFGDVE